MWGLAAGLIEEKHGEDPSVAAQHELEEECHLTGGTWIPLSKAPSAMDKYALTSVAAYLVLDAQPATNPKPLDEEEDIEEEMMRSAIAMSMLDNEDEETEEEMLKRAIAMSLES